MIAALLFVVATMSSLYFLVRLLRSVVAKHKPQPTVAATRSLDMATMYEQGSNYVRTKSGRRTLVATAALVPVTAGIRGALLVIAVVLAWRQTGSWLQQRQHHQLRQNLPGVLRTLAAGVSAGLSFESALSRTCSHGDDEATRRLRRVERLVSLGVGTNVALDAILDHDATEDLHMVVTTVRSHLRSAGRLADALEDMAANIEDRSETVAEIDAQLASVTSTGKMLTAVGMVLPVLVELRFSGAIATTLSHPFGIATWTIGLFLLGAGLALTRGLIRGVQSP